MKTLVLEPLTKLAFAPFGDVIETDGSGWFPINRGSTKRYHRLGRVEAAGDQAEVAVSIFAGDAFELPRDITLLERHPLGSQCFVPMTATPCVIVVAPPCDGERPDESQIRAFLARGDQGVNYARGTWHHPLMALGRAGDFVVIDRVGSGHNCDEIELREPIRLLLDPGAQPR